MEFCNRLLIQFVICEKYKDYAYRCVSDGSTTFDCFQNLFIKILIEPPKFTHLNHECLTDKINKKAATW